MTKAKNVKLTGSQVEILRELASLDECRDNRDRSRGCVSPTDLSVKEDVSQLRKKGLIVHVYSKYLTGLVGQKPVWRSEHPDYRYVGPGYFRTTKGDKVMKLFADEKTVSALESLREAVKVIKHLS